MVTEKPPKALPTVVIVGRVNVGKSTLFNRLLGAPHSLVSPIPGTTRDVQEALVTWRGIAFSLVDTGGLDAGVEPTGIFSKVIAKAREAVERADLILLITDAQEGALPSDRHVAESLRRNTAKVITVVNKADNPALRMRAAEFSRLGFGEPIPLSAINGTGTGDLLDKIVDVLRNVGAGLASAPSGAEVNPAPTDQTREPIRLAIIGKPNVGKSTLVNAILGYERVIVSPHAHTTREPVDTPLTWNDTPMVLIDTAGIRRKARVQQGLEHAGVKRSIEVLKRADVAIFLIDALGGIDDQDKQLARMMAQYGVGVVIVVNKWDLVRRERNEILPLKRGRSGEGVTTDLGAHYLKYVHGKLPNLPWAPVIFTSALHASHVKEVLEDAVRAAHARDREILQEELMAFFTDFRTHHPLPPLGEERRIPPLVHFIETDTRPPAFELAVKTKERFPEAYIRILEKEIRKQYDLEGTPIRVSVRTAR